MQVFFKGDKEINKAFAMANDQYLQGKYDYDLRDKKDMTDTILEVVGKYSAKRCLCYGRFYEE